ncbi:MAG TPA: hypothetical protein VGP92_15375, partial [Acidimicrobiia bacterium]|nr:hypothetical protein [Acidimicrobiia bacterium]
LAIVVGGGELVVGAGVIAFRGTPGFVFACGMLLACVGFLLALTRAVQRSVPCGCFGRLGRTAAGGREIGRALALAAGAAFLVVHRALDARTVYGLGPVAGVAVVAMGALIVLAQQVGAHLRPGVEVRPESTDGRSALTRNVRRITGYDSDIYTTSP